MSKSKISESEADRALAQWARNIQRGYVNLSAGSIDFSDFVGGHTVFIDDYSPQEERCLKEMSRVQVDDPQLYKVALLEYVKQAGWFADCREDGGWYEYGLNIFHSVDEPSRMQFFKFVHANYFISKTQFYNRLKRLQKRIAEQVI